jgi:iron complex transport system permease protein
MSTFYWSRGLIAGKDIPLIAVLACVGLLLALASLSLGTVSLSWSQVAGGLLGTGDPADILIVRELRLPRTILAIMIGAILALAGAALQGLMRNPLAAPDVLGAPGAAAFGAVLAISTGLADALSFALPLAAIAMALLSVAALLALAGPQAGIVTLLLAGLALSSLAGALVSLTLNLAPSLYATLEITFWLLGSLEDRSFRHVAIAAPFLLAAAIVLLATRRPLAALSLGEDVARSSGVDLVRLNRLTLAGVAAGVGASVAVAGVIGFVGLVVPHLIRPLVGHDPARVHVPAMIAGAVLLLAADCLVRLVPVNAELHIGVVTALIGVPFFIWLVLDRRRNADLAAGTGASS